MNAYFVFLTQVTVLCLILCRVQINQGAISDTTALWAEGDGCGVGSSHTVDRRWEDCLRPSRCVCVCVSGIIIPALYSQQITSDLYVGVNPGMKRGTFLDVLHLQPLGLRGFGCPNSYKHNETTVPFTPTPQSLTPPPRITANWSANPIHSTAGSQHKGDQFSFEWMNLFHGIWQRSAGDVSFYLF